MKVFASNFLEPLKETTAQDIQNWIWEPANKEVKEIYASGNKSMTRASTYSAEKDNQPDTDRPNEGC